MSTKDGGPAFPVGDFLSDRGLVERTGMSLRDYFAGQALTAFRLRPSDWAEDDLEVAKCVYRIADAMLAAREKAP